MKRVYSVLIALCLIGWSAHAQESAIAITDIKIDKTYAKRPYPVIRGKINNATAEELEQIVLKFVGASQRTLANEFKH